MELTPEYLMTIMSGLSILLSLSTFPVIIRLPSWCYHFLWSKYVRNEQQTSMVYYKLAYQHCLVGHMVSCSSLVQAGFR